MCSYKFLATTKKKVHTCYHTMTLTTVSGDPITIGIGTGTSIKDLKRGQPTAENKARIVDILRYALLIGYNHIDTAEVYTTQPEVGTAIAGFQREKLWITTKYSVTSSMIKKKSFTPTDFVEQALDEMNTNYIDLLLLHFPPKPNDPYTIQSLWQEFVSIKATGKVRYIGVSNFDIPQLNTLLEIGTPTINQIQYYLGSDNLEVVEFCKNHGILVEAYGPLTPLRNPNPKTDALIEKLQNANHLTKSQALFRYLLDNNILPITTSFKKERLKEALHSYTY